MYVCLCKAVTDRHIREAVEDGARTMRELRMRLGLCSSCGRCGVQARELLTEACAHASATAVHINLPARQSDHQDPIWSAA